MSDCLTCAPWLWLPRPSQRNVYDPIKPLDPYGTVVSPTDGTPVVTLHGKGGKKWNEMDAYGPNAERRHRGFAPCPGDLAHLPGNQPHHTVFTPSFLDIKKDERYTRTSSRIGKSYCTPFSRPTAPCPLPRVAPCASCRADMLTC